MLLFFFVGLFCISKVIKVYNNDNILVNIDDIDVNYLHKTNIVKKTLYIFMKYKLIILRFY